MNFKPIARVDYLVVHCSATQAKMDVHAADIDRWHRQEGWLSIGYHYVICRDGSIEKGREDNVPGAHARGFNHLSLGICLAGGVAADGKSAENNFTDAQFVTLAKLLLKLKGEHPGAEVLGHRDLPDVAKACPSFDTRAWWKTVQEIC